MKTIGSSLLFAICTLSLAATAQAGERWQEIGSGGYRVYAPPSWVVERGGATDLIISAAKPEAAKMSFTVMNNPGRNGDLPDIYGVMDMARSLARFYKISLTSEPDSGGRPIAGHRTTWLRSRGVLAGVTIAYTRAMFVGEVAATGPSWGAAMSLDVRPASCRGERGDNRR